MSPIERSAGGGGSSAITQIFTSTAGADVTGFDITGISGSFTVLKLIGLLRDDAADAFVGSSFVTFNGDSGANYSWQYMRGFGGSTGAGNNDASTFALGPMETDNTVTANYFGAGEMVIPFYANTTTYKTAVLMAGALGGGGNDELRPASSMWRNTAAINRITVAPGAGTHFKAGSAVVLYGLT